MIGRLINRFAVVGRWARYVFVFLLLGRFAAERWAMRKYEQLLQRQLAKEARLR